MRTLPKAGLLSGMKFNSIIFKAIEMNAVELKSILIHRITEIDDVSFLEAIRTILDSKSNKQRISLTAEQQADIQESRKQIAQGLFVGQEELDTEIGKWLCVKSDSFS